MPISKIKRSSGVVYRVRKVLPNGIRVSRYFKTKAEAENFEASLILNPQGTTTRRIRFEEFCKRFLEVESIGYLQRSTQEKYRGLIEQHLMGPFGGRHIESITRDECVDFVAEICKSPISEHQKYTIVSTAKTLFQRAVDFEYINRNPMASIKPPRKPFGKNDFWKEAEAREFLTYHADSKRFPIYMLAFNTGMRLGEIFGLMWDCVNLANGTITVKRIWCQKLNAVKETTKTRKSRTFAINDVLLSYLQELKLRSNSETVIDHATTGCKNPAHASRSFQTDALLAGMKKIIRFHDIRHTFISNYMMNGGTELECRKIVGHSSSAQLDHYTHLSPEAQKRSASILCLAPSTSKVIAMSSWT